MRPNKPTTQAAYSISAHLTGRTSLGCAEVKEAAKKNTPQTDKGFLRLASGDAENDLVMPLIAAQLTGVEWQVVMLVIRKTYGYGKKEDWISLSQFEKYSRRSRKGVCIGIASLKKKNIIHTRHEKQKTYYSFNKNFASWKVVNASTLVYPSSLPKKTKTSERQYTTLVNASTLDLVNASTHTKDNVTKDNYTKEILHTDTVSLFDWLSAKCISSKIKFKVNVNELNRIVDKFLGKVKMRTVLQSYLTWMIDEQKKTLRTVDVENCFVRQVAYEKTRQLAKAETKQEKMRLKR